MRPLPFSQDQAQKPSYARLYQGLLVSLPQGELR